MDKPHTINTAVRHVTEDQVAKFLAGVLDAEARGRLKAHLQRCAPCIEFFPDVLTKAKTLATVAPSERAMPRPPAAVLRALGLQTEEGAFDWLRLLALEQEGISWAHEELNKLRATLLAAVLGWFRVRASSEPPRGIRVRGGPLPTLDPDYGWPRQIEVEVVDSAKRPQGRKVRFEVVEPPTVYPTGQFGLTLRTTETGAMGGTLLCMITDPVKVAVPPGELTPSADDQGWKVTIRVPGFLAPGEIKESVVIPKEQIELSLQSR